MIEHTAKIVVAGAGPAGLVSAILLAQAGIDVICLAPPAGQDPRTVALMQPALNLLRKMGVWTPGLQEQSAPLDRLHIIDDTGNMVSAPDLRFAAQELNLESFGWNVPLSVLIPQLHDMASQSGVRCLANNAISATSGKQTISIRLDSDEIVRAEVAIAADGSNSVLRQSAGIDVEHWSFDQQALVTQFSHSGPHENTSTEWHKRGGPFTTVPLPGRRSSLVWMDKPAAIQRLMNLSPAALAREIQLNNHGNLGLISDVLPARCFAMKGAKAKKFANARTLLVGEAAHVFPPLGAQGLNMSLRDAAFAVELIEGAEDAGSEAVMKDYERLRRSDVGLRSLAINMMNQSLLAEMLPPHLLRSAGLAAVANFPFLRRSVMQQGLASGANLPFAMR